MSKLVLVGPSESSFAQEHLPFLRLLLAQKHELALLVPDDGAAALPWEKGIAVHAMPTPRPGTPWGAFALRWRMGRRIRREKAGLVHFFDAPGAWSGAQAALSAGVPAVLITLPYPGASLPFPERKALASVAGDRRAWFLGRNPEEAAAFATEWKLPQDRVWLVRAPGVNLETFHPPREARVFVDGQPTRMLFGGRFRRDGGLDELRQACLILRAKKLEFELVVAGAAGAGDREHFGVEELRAWQKEGWMRLLGPVEAMPALLRSVEIVVFAGARRGLPRLLVEAAASGRAIVAPDLPGARELIAPDKSGIVFRTGDPPSLARAIERCIRETELRAELGRNARTVAEALFNEAALNAKRKGVYEKLLLGGK